MTTPPLRILSIDDSKAVHAFLNAILEGAGHIVLHAFDGLQGLEALTSGGEKPDLILLDWEMPKLTGIETLKKIRAHGITIPIIMLTTKNSPEDIGAALAEGASEYVMKPFTAPILLEKIGLLLNLPAAGEG